MFASISIINDTILEDNETVRGEIKLFPSCLSLSLGISSAIATLIDDDGKYIYCQELYNIESYII